MNAKTFTIGSIAAVGIYMFLVGLLTNPTGHLTTLENMIQFWIPTALITNAVIVAPMVTRKKLDPASRKSLTKVLIGISLLLFSIAMITLHVIAPFDWGHVAVWAFNTMASLVFIAVYAISKISDKIKNTDHFSNYVLPFFTIGLIIWAFFITLLAILS